jgi:hypothetical protein
MPALNYKAQFAELVASGAKYHTIRQTRMQPIAVGDTLMHYTGMRTKKCRKLRADTICVGTPTIYIHATASVLMGSGGHYYERGYLSSREVALLARKDGFPNSEAFFAFFEKNYGPEFSGNLIEWLA